LAFNAFNYNVLGVKGFDCISKLIENTDQIEITYNNLAEVDELLTREFIS